jgi:hypothetical protein
MSKHHRFTLDPIIDGYVLHARSKRLSKNTLSYYSYAHRKLLNHVSGDTPIEEITVGNLCPNVGQNHLAVGEFMFTTVNCGATIHLEIFLVFVDICSTLTGESNTHIMEL